jgi:hypothetical protein
MLRFARLVPVTWRPEIEGALAIRSASALFRRAFSARVAAGLLAGHPHPRSNYQVVEEGPDRLRVRAVDWWTAINVGLNDLELTFGAPDSVSYRVRYWRWTWYAVGLGAALGTIGLVLLLTLDVRPYIAGEGWGMIPGLSADQNLSVAWVMVVFWGFVWPWLLVSLHKPSLRGLVVRLIREVDTQAVSGRA